MKSVAMQEESKIYPIPLKTLSGLDLRYHLADMLEFQDFLEKHCICTQNTRIQRYVEYLKQHVHTGEFPDPFKIFKTSTDGPFESPIDWHLYVLREVHELMWILKGLKVHEPSGLDEKLKIIVSGRDFAALDVDSHSRNTQFELRIASYFCQAGWSVDLSTETDVIALSDRVAFYCECKRVSNSKQLQKKLSEAKKQLSTRMPGKLECRDIFGCIALDVTKVASPNNGLTWGITNDHSRDVIRDKLNEIAKGLSNQLLFQNCRHLLDCWLQIHIPSFIMRPPTPTTRFSSRHILKSTVNRKERRVIETFRSLFESVTLRSDPRERQPRALTLRTSLTVPRGTSFGFRDDLILDFLEKGKVDEKRKDDWVARIEINDEPHFFSIWDFSMILSWFKDKYTDVGGFRKALEQNPGPTKLELVIEMYLFRFPYENDGEAEKHPASHTTVVTNG